MFANFPCFKRLALLVTLSTLLPLTAGSRLLAEGVSRKAPEEYGKFIKPLLTPIEEVKSWENAFAEQDEPGVVLLSEIVTRAREDGSYLRAIRYIYRPQSQRGVDQVATDRFGYSSRLERLHLAEARTILPDGEIKELGPNAAFIQKGRRQTANMYDDAQDLVVVFPDVKVGVLCEVIVVVERFQPSVADGYSQFCGWGSGWPILRKRMVVDLPEAWEKRIQFKSIGPRVEPRQLESADDRRIHEWVKGNIDEDHYEPAKAPVAQVGPVSWLTTFQDWNGVAAWYQKLLDDRSELGAELEALVDEWTRGVEAPNQIIEILHDKVANDVRYEGLEFGMSGLQPYACATVWDNQYGDCKDKSNLLVAMLRHKGVEAHLVLVNTEHAGLVDQRIPDFRHFDHAIAAVRVGAADGERQWLFCDPTIKYGSPGMLAPSSAGRKVLAIDDGKALWLETPDTDAGSRHYDIQLKMAEDGRMTGWIEVRAKGLYAIHDISSYHGLDRQSARYRLQDEIESFMAGTNVVDFVLPEKELVEGGSSYKIFITTSPRQPDEKGRLSLAFPAPEGLFYDYGEGEGRQTPYFQWRDKVSLNARVELPTGWQPEALPSPIQVGGDAYRTEASWSVDQGHCRANLVAVCLQSVIPADDVALYAQANRALFTWLEAPLLIQRGDKVVKMAKRDEVELPLMPTGEGQLNLVDELYPVMHDASKRRAALEKVIQYFPNDAATVFDAKVRIGIIFYDTEKWQEADRYFSHLLSQGLEALPPENVAWARYMHALCIHEADQADRAIGIMRELAKQEGLSQYRRGWAAFMAALWLGEDENADGGEVEALLWQSLAGDVEMKGPALAALIGRLVEREAGDALVELLSRPESTEGLEEGGLPLLVAAVADWKEKQIRFYHQQLQVVSASSEVDPALAGVMEKAAQEIEVQLGQRQQYAAARARMVEVFEEFSAGYLDGDRKEVQADELIQKLDEVAGGAHAEWLKLAATYFRDLETLDRFGRICWLTLDHARLLHGRDAQDEEGLEFVQALADACLLLPKGDEHHWEARFVEARFHEEFEEWKKAQLIYQAMIEDGQFHPDYDQAAWHRLGKVLELQGEIEEAVKCYRHFAHERKSYAAVVESLLRAGLLNASLGKREEALDTWKLLADVPAGTYEDSAMSNEIAEAVILAEQRDQTLEQWRRTETWWNEHFLGLMNTLGAEDARGVRIFLPDCAQELDARCTLATRDKDFAPIAGDLHSVAMSARWLPSQAFALWQVMDYYVEPMRPASSPDNLRVLMELTAAIRVGSDSSVGFAKRMHLYGSTSLGDHDRAFSVVDDLLEDFAEGSEEHVERSVYLIMSAALAAEERMNQALQLSGEQLERGLHYIAPAAWVSVHADLLIKNGQVDEAVAFLEQKLDEPLLARREQAEPIRDKLRALSESNAQSQALKAAVQRLLAAHKPNWYDHVGPMDLDDPRVGDPAAIDVMDLDHLHELEVLKLRLLVAQSDEVPLETRRMALGEAAMTLALEWRETWQDAIDSLEIVINDKDLPDHYRRMVLWETGSELMAAGQVELLQQLLSHPLMKHPDAEVLAGLGEDFLAVAMAHAGDHDALREAARKVVGRELGVVDLSVIQVYHATLLAIGDLEAAAQLRQAIKDCRLKPEVVGKIRGLRMGLIKELRQMEPAMELIAGIEKLAEARIHEQAAKAPEGWFERIDLTSFDGMNREDRNATLGAMVKSGKRHDRSLVLPYFRYLSFWLGDPDSYDRKVLMKAVDLVHTGEDLPLPALCIGTLLFDEAVIEERKWEDLDQYFEEHRAAGARREKEAVIGMWQALREWKPGMPLDFKSLNKACEDTGTFGIYMRNELLACAIMNGDIQGVRLLVDATDFDELERTDGTLTYMQALALLEREDELALMVEDLGKTLNSLMMDSWCYDRESVFEVWVLALRHGLGDRIPDQWWRDMVADCVEEDDAIVLRAARHGLEGDWEAALEELGRMEDPAASMGFSELLTGMAQANLGLADAARKTLKELMDSQSTIMSHRFWASNALSDL